MSFLELRYESLCKQSKVIASLMYD
jgi:hypothetical protein